MAKSIPLGNHSKQQLGFNSGAKVPGAKVKPVLSYSDTNASTSTNNSTPDIKVTLPSFSMNDKFDIGELTPNVKIPMLDDLSKWYVDMAKKGDLRTPENQAILKQQNEANKNDALRKFNDNLNKAAASAEKKAEDASPVFRGFSRFTNAYANGLTGGQAVGSNPDLGTVGNAIADTAGFGFSMGAKNPMLGGNGTSIQSVLTPAGNVAENAVAKGLSKIAPSLPSLGNKVANYVLPTAAKLGAEGAVYGGTLGAAQGKDLKGIASDALTSGAQFAAFGVGMKGLGSAFTHTLGKLGKVKVESDNGTDVTYTKEDGSTGTMKKTVFDKEAKPLTVNEGLNTLNQSKVSELPTFKGEFNKEVTNDVPTVSKVETKVEQPKPEIGKESLFTDHEGRLNGGEVTKINTDGTLHIKTPEGNEYKVAKNGENYEVVMSKADAQQNPFDREFADNAVLKDKNVKPIQQLHPELKGHIQQEAETILGELKRSTKGEKLYIKTSAEKDGMRISGNKRITSPEIAKMLDEGYSYQQIENALNNIVKDHGSENTLVAKKIEAMIDSRLSNGHTDYETGTDIPANGEYVKAKSAITQSEPISATLDNGQASGSAKVETPVSEPVNAQEGTNHVSIGATNRTHIDQDLIIGPEDTRTKVEKLKDGAKDLRQHVVDIYDNLKGLTDNGETHVKAVNSRKVAGTVSHIHNKELVDMEGNPIGESLKSIAKDMPQDKEAKKDFLYYVLQKHNIDRAREEKNIFPDWNSYDSQKYVELMDKTHPEYKGLNDRMVKFVNTFMEKWGKDSGLITEDLWTDLNKTYKNYVPTNRDFSDLEKGVKHSSAAKGFVSTGNGLKKATGSERDIIDPTENIMNLVNKYVRLARNNEVGQSLLKALRDNPEGNAHLAEIVPDTIKVKNPKYKPPTASPLPTPTSTLKPFQPKYKNGNVRANKGAPMLKPAMKPFTSKVEPEFIEKKVDINPNVNHYVTVLDKGEPVYVKVNDLNFLESLKNVYKQPELLGYEKKLATATQHFKNVITTDNPFFAIFNAARDLPTAYIYGSEGNPVKFTRDYVKAMGDVISGNLEGSESSILKAIGGKIGDASKANKYKAVGGTMADFFNPGESAQAVKKLTADKKNVAQKGLGIIRGFNEAIETAPRLAEFNRALKNGDDVSTALSKAGEVTVDFSKGGDWTKKIDQTGVPYLNAAVQGLDRFGRSMVKQKDNGKMGVNWQTVRRSAFAITFPTVALNLINWNNEDYKALDNRTKDTYYCIPNIADGGKTFFKLPKSKETGVLFGALTERIIRQMKGEENSFKGFGGSVLTNFSPNNPFTNNIYSPATIGLISNKDFAGRTIVPQAMQDLSKEYQYDETTSEIGKLLGKLPVQPLSPKQIDYLIKSYTGVIGQFLLPATTAGTYEGGGAGAALTKPVKTKFVADPLYSNQSITDFYDNYDMLKKLAGDINFENNIDSEEHTTAENYKNYFLKVSKEMSALSKAAAQSKDPDEVKQLRQRMIDLAKQANEALPSSNYNKLKSKVGTSTDKVSLPTFDSIKKSSSSTKSSSKKSNTGTNYKP